MIFALVCPSILSSILYNCLNDGFPSNNQVVVKWMHPYTCFLNFFKEMSFHKKKWIMMKDDNLKLITARI